MTGHELRQLLVLLDDGIRAAATQALDYSDGHIRAEEPEDARAWQSTAAILNDASGAMAELLGTPGITEFLAFHLQTPARASRAASAE